MLPWCANKTIWAAALAAGLAVGCSDDGGKRKAPAPAPEQPPADGDGVGGVPSKSGAFEVRLDWSAGPAKGLENRLTLVFGGQNGVKALHVSDVSVKPWMSVHDHGAPMRQQRVERTDDPAAFAVSGVNFIMPGPWELEITATVDGLTDTAVAKVDVP